MAKQTQTPTSTPQRRRPARSREIVMALLRSGRSFGEAANRANLPLDDVIALWRAQN